MAVEAKTQTHHSSGIAGFHLGLSSKISPNFVCICHKLVFHLGTCRVLIQSQRSLHPHQRFFPRSQRWTSWESQRITIKMHDTIFLQVKGSSKTSSHQQPVKAAPTKKPTTTTTTTMKKSNLSKETPPPAQRRTRNSSVESVDESLDSDSDSEEKKHPKKVISKKSGGGGGSAMSSPKVTLTSFPSFSNFSDFFPTSSILFCVEEVFLGRWWWWIRFLLHATHRGTSTKKLEIWKIVIKLSWKRKLLTMHTGCGTTKTIKWKFEM